MSKATHTGPVHCMRCGRTLYAARSVAAGYGPGCRTRIRAAGLAAHLRDFTTAQIEKARELIADRGLIPAATRGVWSAVSSDGTGRYLTRTDGCDCLAGQHGHRCYHVAAVLMVAA